jgi:hypothetical protein
LPVSTASRNAKFSAAASPSARGKLLDLDLLPPQRALGWLVGRAAVEAYRDALAIRADDEDKVGAVVQHLEPRIFTRAGSPLQPMAAEGEGPAADRPGIVTQFVAGHGQRLTSGIGEQAGANP